MADLPSMDDPYVYNADLVRILDGDTARLKLWRPFKAEWDFGFYIKEEINTVRSVEINCRLHGLNAPEIHGVKGAELKKGQASTAELTRLLGLGKLIAKTHKPDKYGRYLVELWVVDKDGKATDVNASLLEHGFAKPYMVNR
jgi:endonuclease YncB( thermonuclease family)